MIDLLNLNDQINPKPLLLPFLLKQQKIVVVLLLFPSNNLKHTHSETQRLSMYTKLRKFWAKIAIE